MMAAIEIIAGLIVLICVALIIRWVLRVSSTDPDIPKDETGRYRVGAIPLDPKRKQCLLPEEWDEALEQKEKP